jgi:hypothetical protein
LDLFGGQHGGVANFSEGCFITYNKILKKKIRKAEVGFHGLPDLSD